MTGKRSGDDDGGRVGARTHEDSSGRRAADAASRRMLDIGSEKLYFKIGEVAEIVGVAPHVLRYWETEFPSIKPQKSRSQQRVFRRRAVETLLKIKHLLYDEKFTIAGARRQMRTHRDEIPAAPPELGFRLRQSVARLREQVETLQALLRHDDVDADRNAADPAAYLRARGGAEGMRSAGTAAWAGGPGAASSGLTDRAGGRLFDRDRGAREAEFKRLDADAAAEATPPWPDGEGSRSSS